MGRHMQSYSSSYRQERTIPPRFPTRLYPVATESHALLGNQHVAVTHPHLDHVEEEPISFWSRVGQWKYWSLVFWISISVMVLLDGYFFFESSSKNKNSSNRHFATKTANLGPNAAVPHLQRTVSPLNDDDNNKHYVATQFISFTINTLGGLASHGECDGRAVDPQTGVCYLGNARNVTEDVQHRFQIVQDVLNRIKTNAESDDPDVDCRDDVLKIVMLPEFFLRGPDGAYSTADFYEGSGILTQVADDIREIIKDPFFSNYLFVWGTVIAARPVNDTTVSTTNWNQQESVLSPSEFLYFNLAPVYKGGPTNNPRYIVTKKYISTVDFLNRTVLPNPRTDDNIREYSSVSGQFRSFFDARGAHLVENNVIELDGLRIGIEICLDHRMGRLWENVKGQDNDGLVDVLLISSAGMSIERGPNPVVPGGVVYLTDGEASSAACLRTDREKFNPDKVCRDVKPDGLKHIPMTNNNNNNFNDDWKNSYYSNFFTISACIDVEDTPLLDGYYSLYQTQGCANTLKLYGIDVMDEFKYYPPSIEIYPTVDLPPPRPPRRRNQR